MPSIWKYRPDLHVLNQMMANTMMDHLGIVVTEIGDNHIAAKMEITSKSRQPMGLLHGGASAAISESMGSIAGVLILDDITKESIVGVELNANHLRSAKSGIVRAVTKPVKIGRRLQVWNTEITDRKGQLLCVSRLTTMRVAND